MKNNNHAKESCLVVSFKLNMRLVFTTDGHDVVYKSIVFSSPLYVGCSGGRYGDGSGVEKVSDEALS